MLQCSIGDTPMNIKSLSPFELHKYEEHLLRLAPQDRYLRFSGHVSDESIHTYVKSIDPLTSVVKAIYNDELEVVAAIHVLVYNNGKDAEIALSVDSNYRGRGYGHALFEAAMKWVQSRSIEKIYSMCLRENRPMNKIATSRGMTVHHDSMETEAYLNVDKPSLSAIWSEILGEQWGWADYTSKSFRIIAGGKSNLFEFPYLKKAS